MEPVMIAKFKVIRRSEIEDGIGTVELQVVTRGSAENEKFFKWTPSGTISVGTVNQPVLSEMTPGREFYVHFIATAEPTKA